MKYYNSDYMSLDVGDVILEGDLIYTYGAYPEECSECSAGNLFLGSTVIDEDDLQEYDGATIGISCAYRKHDHPTVVESKLNDLGIK